MVMLVSLWLPLIWWSWWSRQVLFVKWRPGPVTVISVPRPLTLFLAVPPWPVPFTLPQLVTFIVVQLWPPIIILAIRPWPLTLVIMTMWGHWVVRWNTTRIVIVLWWWVCVGGESAGRPTRWLLWWLLLMVVMVMVVVLWGRGEAAVADVGRLVHLVWRWGTLWCRGWSHVVGLFGRSIPENDAGLSRIYS